VPVSQEETMKRLALPFFALCMAIGVAVSFAQAQFGTAAEAKAMLERAVSELKADAAKALAKFNAGSDGFKDRATSMSSALTWRAASSPLIRPSWARISGR
jgi:hypothetical protein